MYVVRHYPKPVYDADVAVDMLKSFQKLDFTPEDQPLFIELKLDMKLEKKVHNALFKHVSLHFVLIVILPAEVMQNEVFLDILKEFKCSHDDVIE